MRSFKYIFIVLCSTSVKVSMYGQTSNLEIHLRNIPFSVLNGTRIIWECSAPYTFSIRSPQVVPTASGSSLVTWYDNNKKWSIQESKKLENQFHFEVYQTRENGYIQQGCEGRYHLVLDASSGEASQSPLLELDQECKQPIQECWFRWYKGLDQERKFLDFAV